MQGRIPFHYFISVEFYSFFLQYLIISSLFFIIIYLLLRDFIERKEICEDGCFPFDKNKFKSAINFFPPNDRIDCSWIKWQ